MTSTIHDKSCRPTILRKHKRKTGYPGLTKTKSNLPTVPSSPTAVIITIPSLDQIQPTCICNTDYHPIHPLRKCPVNHPLCFLASLAGNMSTKRGRSKGLDKRPVRSIPITSKAADTPQPEFAETCMSPIQNIQIAQDECATRKRKLALVMMDNDDSKEQDLHCQEEMDDDWFPHGPEKKSTYQAILDDSRYYERQAHLPPDLPILGAYPTTTWFQLVKTPPANISFSHSTDTFAAHILGKQMKSLQWFMGQILFRKKLKELDLPFVWDFQNRADKRFPGHPIMPWYTSMPLTRHQYLGLGTLFIGTLAVNEEQDTIGRVVDANQSTLGTTSICIEWDHDSRDFVDLYRQSLFFPKQRHAYMHATLETVIYGPDDSGFYFIKPATIILKLKENGNAMGHVWDE